MKKNILFVLFALFSVVLIVYAFNQLTICKVIIVSPDANILGLNQLEGQNLFLLNKDKIIKFIKDENPNIAQISISKLFPCQIRLEINLKKSVAFLETGNTKIAVDKEGHLLFGVKAQPFLPQISFDSQSKLSEDNDWRIAKASLIIDLLDKESIPISQIILHDSESAFFIYLNEGTTVLIPYTQDPYSFAASLQVIIHRFRIEGKFISKIDFRFEKPVVQLKNEEKNSSSVN